MNDEIIEAGLYYFDDCSKSSLTNKIINLKKSSPFTFNQRNFDNFCLKFLSLRSYNSSIFLRSMIVTFDFFIYSFEKIIEEMAYNDFGVEVLLNQLEPLKYNMHELFHRQLLVFNFSILSENIGS